VLFRSDSHLLLAARLLVASARVRKDSVGAHYRTENAPGMAAGMTVDGGGTFPRDGRQPSPGLSPQAAANHSMQRI
jgi:hypothetical protein